MEKKENYEKPELIFGTTAIRCSLLAGSTPGGNGNPSQEPSTPVGGGGASSETVGGDPNDPANQGARVRGGLSF